jgi:hypothetical protein
LIIWAIRRPLIAVEQSGLKWCASSVEQQTREISTVAFSFDERRTSVALALKAMVAQSHLNGKTRKEFTIRQLAEIVELALMLTRDLENLLLEELPSRQLGSTHPSAIAHRVTKPGCAPPCEPESATASRTRFSSDSRSSVLTISSVSCSVGTFMILPLR